MFTPEQLTQYAAAREAAAFAPLARSQIRLTGKDRATLLHKFCTQEILSRAPGQGGEAFICNVQGKIAGYIYFYVAAESLLLDTSPGLAESLIQHLDRYVIREDVQFEDLTPTHTTLLVIGPAAASKLSELTGSAVPPAELFAHGEAEIAGVNVSLRQVPFASDTSYFVDCERESASQVAAAFHSSGLVQCDAEVVETLRIESGAPLYGSDITLENLPQEIARDAQTISFKKGCYLGQETVARIDALGHVNKLLTRVKLAGDGPLPVGTELKMAEKVVGRITSAAWSPAAGCAVALAFVRREQCKPGTTLSTAIGAVEVVATMP
ncbi:MAG TPA: glycine cleavage T C-terminal barrel domain-containing protein [Pirellulaceae bacterium]|nr:glycine cleavage T C-terminal barrel domain-containing protein [Pirellulaceae bacterium]